MQVQPLHSRAAGELRAAAAVFAVAEDRGSEYGTMRPQLVGAAGHWQQRQPACLVAGMIDDPVVGNGGLALRVVGMHALTPGPAALREGEVYAALAQLRQADHDGPVDLPGGLVSKPSGDERGGGGVTCDQQHARGVLVEPVHETRALGAIEAQAVE